MKIAVMGGYRKDTYITTTIRVIKDGETRIVHHYWFDTWPDHGGEDMLRLHSALAHFSP